MLFYNQAGMLLGWGIIQYFTQIGYSICFDYTFQELETSMDLHTSSIDPTKLNYKLAISTARDKNVCQKIL